MTRQLVKINYKFNIQKHIQPFNKFLIFSPNFIDLSSKIFQKLIYEWLQRSSSSSTFEGKKKSNCPSIKHKLSKRTNPQNKNQNKKRKFHTSNMFHIFMIHNDVRSSIIPANFSYFLPLFLNISTIIGKFCKWVMIFIFKQICNNV